MIGHHVFLIETAFIGIVRYRLDDGYVAESIGSHFDDNRPKQVVFYFGVDSIIRDTWPALRDTIIEMIVDQIDASNDFKVKITNEQCNPMVLHLLWGWHMYVKNV